MSNEPAGGLHQQHAFTNFNAREREGLMVVNRRSVLKAGLAGIAGVMMSGFKTVFPAMGTPMVVDGFLVVVAGGVGSLLGSIASAGLLGQINGVTASLTNDILARAVVFGVVILILILKPQGLFSFKGR